MSSKTPETRSLMVLEKVDEVLRARKAVRLRMAQNEGFFKGILHSGVSFFLRLVSLNP